MQQKINIYADAEEASQALVDIFINSAETSITNQGYFSAVLSGGGTPQRFFELLSQPANAQKVSWENVHFFWADDRCVPPNQDGSNYKQARLALLDHIPIPAQNIWRIKTELACEQAAENYSEQLFDFAQKYQSEQASNWPNFDFVLLGMGNDGHTASIFPNSPLCHNISVRIASADYEDRPSMRVTLTEAVLNYAHNIYYLILGDSKSSIIRTVLVESDDILLYPLLRIRPVNGTVTYMLDSSSSSLLPIRPNCI